MLPASHLHHVLTLARVINLLEVYAWHRSKTMLKKVMVGCCPVPLPALSAWFAHSGLVHVTQGQSRPADGAAAGGAPMSTLSSATRILVLENAVTVEELADDEEYRDIIEDMKEECGKHGLVQQVGGGGGRRHDIMYHHYSVYII